MSVPDFEIYDRPGYFQALIHHAESAGPGDRLTIMSMILDRSVAVISQLVEALCAAARRGADIRLVIDSYSFILSEKDQPGPLLLTGRLEDGKMGKAFQQTYDALEQLRQAGGHYMLLNRPERAFSNPYAGRSHIKLAIFNDRVYLGGCNLDHPKYRDLMVSWQDATFADQLQTQVDHIAKAASVGQALDGQDLTLDINDAMRLFIDSGVRRQSLILQQAHQLIDQAKEHVTITCQYFPGGQTAERLLAARKRGVQVTIYYGAPGTHGFLTPAQWLYNSNERLRLPAEFFRHKLAAPKIHAKIIVTESAVMLGSHNYVQAGVNLGTAEIALLVNDVTFATRVRDYCTELCATNGLNKIRQS
jgi:phosphatidylserine/phosphatidylglycerophosphate/cardiolipin synthase-like enzyme